MSILEKLKAEVERFQNKPFLKAAMAVCALCAQADGKVSLSERYRVDALLGALEDLRIYDPRKAIELLNDYLYSLTTDHERAVGVLRGKIGRYAGNAKAARTLLRIAYLVVTADGEIAPAEQRVFDSLTALLSADPKAVLTPLLDEMAAARPT